MWLYVESVDPTRDLAKELTEAEVDARIKSVLEVGAMADITSGENFLSVCFDGPDRVALLLG
jgi:hypothetical protein